MSSTHGQRACLKLAGFSANPPELAVGRVPALEGGLTAPKARLFLEDVWNLPPTQALRRRKATSGCTGRDSGRPHPVPTLPLQAAASTSGCIAYKQARGLVNSSKPLALPSDLPSFTPGSLRSPVPKGTLGKPSCLLSVRRPGCNQLGVQLASRAWGGGSRHPGHSRH